MNNCSPELFDVTFENLTFINHLIARATVTHDQVPHKTKK